MIIFRLVFDLTDTTYLAGQTEKNGIPTGWKLFRIPLSDFKNSGSTEWNEIRYIRMSVSDFDSLYSSLQVAKIEIVGTNGRSWAYLLHQMMVRITILLV